MAKSGKTTISEFRNAAKAIRDAVAKMDGPFGVNLRAVGEEIMSEVKDSRPGHGVPVDTGALRSTGRVEGPTFTRHSPEVELSFGGSAAPYALVQHEHLEYHHTVGEARYLVRGLERWSAGKSAAMETFAETAQQVWTNQGENYD